MPSPTTLLLDQSFPLPIDRPFTTAMAHAAGLSRKQLDGLVARGYLWHPLRNAYVATQVPDSLGLRSRIVALVVPEGCFVCDRTAAWLHGAPTALAPNEHLSVPPISCFRPTDEGRLRNGLTDSGERAVAAYDLMVVNGVLVTTPLRTALDLGRLQPTRDLALSGMDAMLHHCDVCPEELLASIARFDRQRGVVQLRALAPLADGRAESPGESALRLRWHDAGLPRPELQIPIIEDGRVIFRLDLGLEELRFAAEYDGEEWHSSPGQIRHDRRRRGILTANGGWLIEVFGRKHVYGLRQDADLRLAAAFKQARATLSVRTFLI